MYSELEFDSDPKHCNFSRISKNWGTCSSMEKTCSGDVFTENSDDEVELTSEWGQVAERCSF